MRMEATQPQSSSQHLTAARKLLDELEVASEGPAGDPQTKAATAVAHATLVLAEQVAAVRVLLVGEAVSRRQDGPPTPQA
jgi:hypothetical protein